MLALTRSRTASLLAAALAASCSAGPPAEREPLGVLPTAVTSAEPQWIPFGLYAGRTADSDPREKRLAELRQLTFDGRSGGALWHPSSREIVLQTGRDAGGCGELVRVHLASGKTVRMSPPRGFAGGAAYGPSNGHEPRLLFAYASDAAPSCPAFGGGLVWTLPPCDLYESTSFVAESRSGSEPALRPVVAGPGFDGDPAVARDGRIVFTSTRDGDPELYLAGPQGRGARRITRSPGYDGGARFSHDGARLVWTSEAGEARGGAERGSVAPRSLEIMLAGSAGQNARELTSHGAFSITPSFLPDSRRVLYASDFDDPQRRAPAVTAGPDPYGEEARPAHDFEIYLVDPDGPVTAAGGPPRERVTYHPGFDGEASVSPDGRYLVFTSSRFSEGGTNVFVARWLDD